ncbi:MAG: DUF998 domain-containing protein [Bacteroidales bacterium]
MKLFQPMTVSKRPAIRIGLVAIWLFFVLEWVTDIWFGSRFPGYDWHAQSMSYLGQSGSPIETWVTLWGVAFTLLILLFDVAFYQTFREKTWGKIAAFALLIYGLGEGLGSGCFPINPPGTPLTFDGRMHNIFSGIGDTGIVSFPFLLMFVFPRESYRGFRRYLWVTVGIGTTMACFFLIAKYNRPDNLILDYKGVWQRIYTLNYDVMLLVVGAKMYQKAT